MKKIILITIAVGAFFASCEKENISFFDNSTCSHSECVRHIYTGDPIEGATVIAYRCDGNITYGGYWGLMKQCNGTLVEYGRFYTNNMGKYDRPCHDLYMFSDVQKTGYWQARTNSGDDFYMGTFGQIQLHIIDTVLLPFYNRVDYRVSDSTDYMKTFLSGNTDAKGDFITDGQCSGDAVNKISFSYHIPSTSLLKDSILYVYCSSTQKTVVNFTRP